MAFLFIIALWVERQNSLKGKNFTNNPLVYALSLAVYCTSWTYYGSVGKATTSGLLFLAIYVGPTLAIVLWWTILRKLVRIKSKHRITSIADFISARYNRSQLLASMVTVAAIVGTMPYIALQLKAVMTTFIIISPQSGASSWAQDYVGHIVVLLMIVFTIVFGVRHIDPTERHQGMITAIAVESLVKLLAFMAAGIFVTYFMYDGFGDIIKRITESAYRQQMSFAGNTGTTYVMWTSYLVLGMAAIMLLPRQFHVAVVENSNERNILSAIWLFPLYMFLINIFVIPIAMAGLLRLPASQADTFVLRLPMESGHSVLTLFVFIGGFSAATSMIMISSMTMATMITNHLVLPAIECIKVLGFLKRHILQCRWVAVALFILMGYSFERLVGESLMLVNIGIMSFAAALQFAPPVLIGIFWKGANRTGAILGMGAGFAVWLYTMLLPSIAKSGWISKTLLDEGPLGIGLLRPEGLFGLTQLDPVTHTVFWSMFFNISLLTIASIYSKTSPEERNLAESFVNALETTERFTPLSSEQPTIELVSKKKSILKLLNQYFEKTEAEVILERCTTSLHIKDKSQISITELAQLIGEIERSLAGSFGAASAHSIITRSKIFTSSEKDSLKETYGAMLAKLRLTPEELIQKIDYYKEKERLLQQHAKESEEKIAQREKEIAERTRVESALRTSDEKLRNINTELDQGLSDVFEALKEISSGNPDVKISEESTLAVISKLKQMVNTTAENLGEIVDLSHDFAIGLAEHFDVLHRVSTGKLDARVSGSSQVDLLESLKKVTNQMIDSVSSEIAERKQAEKEVTESEARLKNILNSIQTGIVIVDEETRQIVDANLAATKMMGASEKEVIGSKCYNFMCVADNNQCPVLDLGKRIDNSQRELITIAGKRVPILKTVISISMDGRRCLLESFINMTELREAEEEKRKLEDHLKRAEKMEAIGTLAGGVAHDLNNILSGLVSYPELLLLDLPEDSPLKGPLLTIQNSGKKAAAIVQDLLTMARRGVAVTEVSNINTIAKDYLQSPEYNRLQSFHQNVEFEARLEADLLNILGSPVHISKTIMNLVSNAAEALPDGGKVVISAQNRYIDKPIRGYDKVNEGDYVVLSVSDTGDGIAAADMERIFEPFYTKKVMGRSGTGLGMTVVWGTVKDHNGYIDIESTSRKGTTFTLYFPVTRKEAQKKESAKSIEDFMGNRERILVVDDVEEQRVLASMLLTKLRYTVDSVSSGEEAVKYMQENSADLLVLDMIMDPGIDGLDTYRKILELHPGQKAIIASGFSETDRVKEVQRLGAGRYVKKPYTIEKIGLAVKAELVPTASSL